MLTLIRRLRELLRQRDSFTLGKGLDEAKGLWAKEKTGEVSSNARTPAAMA